MGFLATLGDRDRLDIVGWSARKESRDIQAQEARQDLMDPQELSVCRDSVVTQASQVPQESPEERANRESLDSQDLRLTSATLAPPFRVHPVTPADLGSLVTAVTKALQGSLVFQVSQEPTQGLECVDRLVSLGLRGQRERRAPQGHRATAPRDRLVPLDCQEHQANPDLLDPPVQVSEV